MKRLKIAGRDLDVRNLSKYVNLVNNENTPEKERLTYLKDVILEVLKADSFSDGGLKDEYKFLSDAIKVISKWSSKYESLYEAVEPSAKNRSFVDELINTLNDLFGMDEIVNEADIQMASYHWIYR